MATADWTYRCSHVDKLVYYSALTEPGDKTSVECGHLYERKKKKNLYVLLAIMLQTAFHVCGYVHWSQ